MALTPKFRLNAVNLYLTYPKCPVPLNEALAILQHKLITPVVKDYALVREFHEDGSPHLHAFIKCGRKANILSQTHLDLNYEDSIYHGNYQTAKSPNSVLSYILKDIKRRDDINLLSSPGISDRIDLLGNWLELGQAVISLAEEGKMSAAINLYKTERPLDFIKNKSRIEKSLNELRMSKLGYNIKFDYSKFIIPEELKTMIDAYNENKTLVIIGSPGIGKSSWLNAWLNWIGKVPLHVNNIDSIRFFDPTKHSALVFDDCHWPDNINREDLIKLVDSESPTTHSVKHSSVVISSPDGGPISRFVLGNFPHKFTNNYALNMPFSDKAVQRRIKVAILKESSSFIPSQ